MARVSSSDVFNHENNFRGRCKRPWHLPTVLVAPSQGLVTPPGSPLVRTFLRLKLGTSFRAQRSIFPTTSVMMFRNQLRCFRMEWQALCNTEFFLVTALSMPTSKGQVRALRSKNNTLPSSSLSKLPLDLLSPDNSHTHQLSKPISNRAVEERATDRVAQ